MRTGFTIHHNGPPARCLGRPHSRCSAFWEGVRTFHMQEQGWSDIAYSFGVCPHGVLFVGRGWDRPQFANGKDVVGVNDGNDANWYTVLAFVGGGLGTGSAEEKPPGEMISAVRDLIHQGRVAGKCGLAVKPHSDFKPKPCPGPTFHHLARLWDGKSFTPPPILPEETDDMFLYSTAGKPVMFCAAGTSVGLNEASDLETFKAAKIPLLQLDDDTYDAFLRSFPRV